MNRFSRITSILIQLQSKRIVTAKEIAKRFEVSLRTVYRDIQTLQEAGVPIGSENGVGYFIVEGYRLPPISLTEEEANALLVSESFIKKQGDTSLSRDFESLLIKIKAVLKYVQQEKIELLESRTANFSKGEIFESNSLSQIKKAITHRQLLKVDYRSLYKEELTQRSIEPLAIYFTNNAWILIAYCRLRQGIREFRLDRIDSLVALNEQFKEHTNFDLKKYFENFSN